jgi:glycosyltransferase involved in cell wall biosynthesis
MVTQFYAPIVGGEERMVSTLSTELVERGHHVAVATLRHSRLPARATVDGVDVYRIQGTLARLDRTFVDSSRPHAPPAPDPEAVVALARVLELEQPDVVHAHNWLFYSLLPLRPIKKFPLVVSLHDYSLVCATKRLMRNGVRPCAGPGPAKCVMCAAHTYGPFKGTLIAALAYPLGRVAETLVDLFLPVSETVARLTGIDRRGAAYEVISNCVPDHPEVSPQPPPGLASVEDGYILFVGDATADKGIDVLLDAHQGLTGPPPLVLIGRRLSPRLRRLPKDVLHIDPVPHAAALAAMRRAAVVVVPSIWDEPFGLTAIEAMSMGRPVVATAAGALPELVVHRETGIVVPPADARLLRDALAELLGSEHLRRQLGEEGLRRSQIFRASSVIPRLERAYARVIARFYATEDAPAP